MATRLGGIFYLIRPLIDLGLPAGFHAKWSADIAGSWGALDLVARALLRLRLAEVAGDPVWHLLAELAAWPSSGTRGSAAASAADVPFRVPSAWSQTLEDPCDHFYWAAGHGRVWVWSRRGYMVAHVRSRGTVRKSAQMEVARFTGRRWILPALQERPAGERPHALPSSTPVGCPPHVRRWAAAVAPAVQRRLEVALATDAAGVVERLQTPATLYVTANHVDIVMDLERADPAVRAAGLDCDLGRLPAYGRAVGFHFR